MKRATTLLLTGLYALALGGQAPAGFPAEPNFELWCCACCCGYLAQWQSTVS